MSEIRRETEHHGVYLGRMTKGRLRHRAFLYKYICDKMGLPCRLVGWGLHAWNVIHDTVDMYVVDLRDTKVAEKVTVAGGKRGDLGMVSERIVDPSTMIREDKKDGVGMKSMKLGQQQEVGGGILPEFLSEKEPVTAVNDRVSTQLGHDTIRRVDTKNDAGGVVQANEESTAYQEASGREIGDAQEEKKKYRPPVGKWRGRRGRARGRGCVMDAPESGDALGRGAGHPVDQERRTYGGTGSKHPWLMLQTSKEAEEYRTLYTETPVASTRSFLFGSFCVCNIFCSVVCFCSVFFFSKTYLFFSGCLFPYPQTKPVLSFWHPHEQRQKVVKYLGEGAYGEVNLVELEVETYKIQMAKKTISKSIPILEARRSK